MDNRTIEEVRENETKLINEINRLEKDFIALKEVNMKLNDNWNELEEWLKHECEVSHIKRDKGIFYGNVLLKMQEIKEGKK